MVSHHVRSQLRNIQLDSNTYRPPWRDSARSASNCSDTAQDLPRHNYTVQRSTFSSTNNIPRGSSAGTPLPSKRSRFKQMLALSEVETSQLEALSGHPLVGRDCNTFSCAPPPSAKKPGTQEAGANAVKEKKHFHERASEIVFTKFLSDVLPMCERTAADERFLLRKLFCKRGPRVYERARNGMCILDIVLGTCAQFLRGLRFLVKTRLMSITKST